MPDVDDETRGLGGHHHRLVVFDITLARRATEKTIVDPNAVHVEVNDFLISSKLAPTNLFLNYLLGFL